MLTQLVHNGIVVPEPPERKGLSITVRGVEVHLTARQEEMALAWARKKDTPYVKDLVFAANFLLDFCAALSVEPPLRLDEVDFAPCMRAVEQEQAGKAALSKEERKDQAKKRKQERDDLKARYGYAIVNGQRAELGNHMAEPSGIFMGRGQHPLRGRWKEGAQRKDITLNLSPDAPPIEGDWAGRVWQPESLWVAKWEDKLAGKLKYVWLSDTTPAKQSREASKFDKAKKLGADLKTVRADIRAGMEDADPRRRMVATACYIIDALCMRVGDEKDPDEADTVGATTLRPEHVTIHDDGMVEFHFLGKDSVEWHKTIRMPDIAIRNLKKLIREARPSSSSDNGKGHPTRDLPQIFPDISSRDVNAFLSKALSGLTAKVFRTHHATAAVRDSLAHARLRRKAPEYLKRRAAKIANLEAAMLCNHTKKASTNWEAASDQFEQREKREAQKVKACQDQRTAAEQHLCDLRAEAQQIGEQLARVGREEKTRAQHAIRINRAEAALEKAQRRLANAEDALGKVRAQAEVASKTLTWNLGTSLKSYIDPRVYYRWGQKVDYDVLGRYYPTILQRKFAWVRLMDEPLDGAPQNGDALEPRGEEETASLAEDSAAGRPAVEDAEHA